MTVPTLTDDLYHYTSSEVALDSILTQMQLRLGLVELMNDPRESRPRYPSLSLADGVDLAADGGADSQILMEEADRLLRRAAKVACFTRDFELPDTALDPSALRGYAHPAQWAHYAGGHTGVCLRFSRNALSEQMSATLRLKGLLFEGPVEYGHELPVLARAIGLDVEQIQEFGLDAVVSRYIERFHHELFFHKHADWASEQEHRWVLVDPEPSAAYVDVTGALTGIVLGDAFPESRLDAIRHFAASLSLDVRKVQFFNQWLHVVPLSMPESRPFRAHRRLGSLDARAKELAEAESSAKQASELGERLAAPLVAQIEVLMRDIGEKAGELSGVEVHLHTSAAAVPPGDRRRAPGVPTYLADYQTGSMCVVENLPMYSFTFVASAAVQAFAVDRLKLYAAFELEQWRNDEPNDRVELWRFATEGVADTASALGDRLVAEMTEQLQSALAAFDARRSSKS